MPIILFKFNTGMLINKMSFITVHIDYRGISIECRL